MVNSKERTTSRWTVQSVLYIWRTYFSQVSLLIMLSTGVLCYRNVPRFLFFAAAEENIVLILGLMWVCREVQSSSEVGKHPPCFKEKGYGYVHRLPPNTDIYILQYQDLLFTHINIGLHLSHSQYSPLESRIV